ncbi:unnamed protein product, partial [Urochloa humidicola]
GSSSPAAVELRPFLEVARRPAAEEMQPYLSPSSSLPSVIDLVMRNLPRRQESVLLCKSTSLGSGKLSCKLCFNHSSKQRPRCLI